MVVCNHIKENNSVNLLSYITISEYDNDYRCKSRIIITDTRIIDTKKYDPLSSCDEQWGESFDP